MEQHNIFYNLIEPENCFKNMVNLKKSIRRDNFFRKVLFALLVLHITVCSTVVKAQTEVSLQEFLEHIPLLFAQIKESAKNNDYQASENLVNETIALISRMPKTNQNDFDLLQSELYYIRACCLSMQNKIEPAIDDFEKAVEFGFTNYLRAKDDKDLDNICTNKRFIVLMENIREKGDYLQILRQSGKYQNTDTTRLPRFSYEAATSDNLKDVRAFFKLDNIAGNGDEVSQIINLLKWVHDNIRHDGSSFALCEFTSIDLYNFHKSTGKGINCRLLAIVLNEIYLAMGFKSRYVTCGSKDNTEVHVINSVYSTKLNKWLWMDPTANAYWKDENGTLLSIEEVRERLIDDRPLILNDDANSNNESIRTKEGYLDGWMVKLLYWFSTPVNSGFNIESRYRDTNQTYISLIPLGDKSVESQANTILTHDAAYFWEQ